MASVTAPDGAVFTDARAYRKHVFNTCFCFKNVKGGADAADADAADAADADSAVRDASGARVLARYPGQVAGQEFHLDGLEDCTVLLLDVMDRVVATNLVNCKVFVGPCKESVAFRKSTGCEVTVAGKEVRFGDCSECTVHAASPMPILLDNCHHMQVGGFNGAYSGLTKHLEQMTWTAPPGPAKVTDFSARDKELPTPHFSMLEGDAAAAPWAVDVEGAAGPPENPFLPGFDPSTAAEPPLPASPPPNLTPDFAAGTGADDAAPADTPAAVDEGDAGADARGEAEAISEATPEGGAEADDDAEAAQAEAAQAEAAQAEAAQAEAAQAETGDSWDMLEEAAGAAVPAQASSQAPAPAPVPAPVPTPVPAPVPAVAALSDPREADAAAGAQQEADFLARVEKLGAEQAQKRAQMKDKGEEELDEHYSQRTDQNAVRYTSNREAERLFVEGLQQASGGGLSWERVASLVDTTATAKNASEAEADPRARMRSLLFKLKGAERTPAPSS